MVDEVGLEVVVRAEASDVVDGVRPNLALEDADGTEARVDIGPRAGAFEDGFVGGCAEYADVHGVACLNFDCRAASLFEGSSDSMFNVITNQVRRPPL